MRNAARESEDIFKAKVYYQDQWKFYRTGRRKEIVQAERRAWRASALNSTRALSGASKLSPQNVTKNPATNHRRHPSVVKLSRQIGYISGLSWSHFTSTYLFCHVSESFSPFRVFRICVRQQCRNSPLNIRIHIRIRNVVLPYCAICSDVAVSLKHAVRDNTYCATPLTRIVLVTHC